MTHMNENRNRAHSSRQCQQAVAYTQPHQAVWHNTVAAKAALLTMRHHCDWCFCCRVPNHSATCMGQTESVA